MRRLLSALALALVSVVAATPATPALAGPLDPVYQVLAGIPPCC